MTKLDMLERVFFLVFVTAANALVVMNMGWALLATSWNSVLLGVAPFLGLATLASFLSFVLLEDYLRTRRYGTDGFQS